MIAKLRIWLSGVVMMLRRVPPEHKVAPAPDQRDGLPVPYAPCEGADNRQLNGSILST
jgi:hypothetical protein